VPAALAALQAAAQGVIGWRRSPIREDPMCRWLWVAALAGLLSGCGTVGDVLGQSVSPSLPSNPARNVLGVSVARPAAGTAEPDAQLVQQLEWKAGQICTRGYDRTRQDIEPAEADQQLVDWQLRCRPYHFSFL
jgi:hypothetical protein